MLVCSEICCIVDLGRFVLDDVIKWKKFFHVCLRMRVAPGLKKFHFSVHCFLSKVTVLIVETFDLVIIRYQIRDVL